MISKHYIFQRKKLTDFKHHLWIFQNFYLAPKRYLFSFTFLCKMSCHSLFSLESLDYLDWVSTLKSNDEQQVTQTTTTSDICEKSDLTLDSLERTPITKCNVSSSNVSTQVGSFSSNSKKGDDRLQNIIRTNLPSSTASSYSTRLSFPQLKICSCPAPSLEVFVFALLNVFLTCCLFMNLFDSNFTKPFNCHFLQLTDIDCALSRLKTQHLTFVSLPEIYRQICSKRNSTTFDGEDDYLTNNAY